LSIVRNVSHNLRFEEPRRIPAHNRLFPIFDTSLRMPSLFVPSSKTEKHLLHLDARAPRPGVLEPAAAVSDRGEAEVWGLAWEAKALVLADREE
jgi:hypothetical protein